MACLEPDAVEMGSRSIPGLELVPSSCAVGLAACEADGSGEDEVRACESDEDGVFELRPRGIEGAPDSSGGLWCPICRRTPPGMLYWGRAGVVLAVESSARVGQLEGIRR